MIHIYTDGGCSGNPGPGGWAYLMVEKGVAGDTVIAEKWDGEKNTTNNRMELLAVINALNSLKSPIPHSPFPTPHLTLYTDSQYVQKGITEWIHNWKRNNWRTSGKQPVKNQDLWITLDALAAAFPIQWMGVKGHAGNTYNERCDALTQRAIASVR